MAGAEGPGGDRAPGKKETMIPDPQGHGRGAERREVRRGRGRSSGSGKNEIQTPAGGVFILRAGLLAHPLDHSGAILPSDEVFFINKLMQYRPQRIY